MSIEVVVAGLEAEPEALRAMAALLCDAEQRRAARFAFERERRRFIVARAQLRRLLGARVGAAPESIELQYGPYGKPALGGRFAASGWRFNVAHCNDVAVYAFSRAGEIGVDVEAMREFAGAEAIAARFFSSAESALGFFECWTRKEAVLKVLGCGLSMALDSFDVSAAVSGGGWRLHSFAPAPGYVAAVALGHLT